MAHMIVTMGGESGSCSGEARSDDDRGQEGGGIRWRGG
jgi:hypothetical protein